MKTLKKTKTKSEIKQFIAKAHKEFTLEDISKINNVILEIPSESESRAIENGIKIYY